MENIIGKVEEFMELGGKKKDIVFLVLGGLSLMISVFDLVPLPFDAAWIAIILCGVPIVLEAIIGLITSFDIKADVLVSLALIASVFIGEDFAAGEVAFIMQLGSLLEDLTVAKARAGIEKLVRLTPQTARVIMNGEEKIIPAEQIKVGDIIRVLPGETIAVDTDLVAADELMGHSDFYVGLYKTAIFESERAPCLRASLAQKRVSPIAAGLHTVIQIVVLPANQKTGCLHKWLNEPHVIQFDVLACFHRRTDAIFAV